MECKFIIFLVFDDNLTELIDTLWNVNNFINVCIAYASKELIDTLWNVN